MGVRDVRIRGAAVASFALHAGAVVLVAVLVRGRAPEPASAPAPRDNAIEIAIIETAPPRPPAETARRDDHKATTETPPPRPPAEIARRDEVSRSRREAPLKRDDAPAGKRPRSRKKPSAAVPDEPRASSGESDRDRDPSAPPPGSTGAPRSPGGASPSEGGVLLPDPLAKGGLPVPELEAPGPSALGPPPRAPSREPLPVPGMKESGEGTYSFEDSAFTAKVNRDGTVELEDRANVRIGGKRADGTQQLGRFDLTDALMSLAGDDPYQAEKARFMEATRELRAALCDKERAEEVRESIFALRGRLESIFRDRSLTVVQRKTVLFRLWDECTEDGGPEALRASAMARATILGFIREKLPEGHRDAYSQEELLALNAKRRSRSTFAPYEEQNADTSTSAN